MNDISDNTPIVNWWSSRIDEIPGINSYEYFESGIKRISGAYLIVEEIASESAKIHWHAVFRSSFSEAHIRRQIFHPKLVEFRMSKHLHKIATVLEQAKACRYLCKGARYRSLPKVKEASKAMFDPSVIEKLHEDYYRYSSREPEIQKKREKQPTFVELVVEESRKYERSFLLQNFEDRRTICHLVLQLLGEKAKIFDSIIVRRLVNGVFNILDPRGMKKYIESQIFEPNLLEYFE